MAEKYLEIPFANPIRMVKLEPSLPGTIYNTRPFDEDWYAPNLPEWMTQTDYAQKWQYTDNLNIQFHTTQNVFSITAAFLNCDGTTFYSFDFLAYPLTVRRTYPNNFIPGTTTPLWTYKSLIPFAGLPPFPEGIYYFRLRVQYSAPGPVFDNEWRISEPLHIAANHPNTLQYDYQNDDSTQNLINEGNRYDLYTFRCESAIVNFDPKSADTQFEDQENNPEMLYSNPYRQFLLVLGINKRLPDWVIDKMNRIMSFNHRHIDGVEYTKDIEAEFTMNRIARYPDSVATINIRPSDNDYGSYTTGTFGPPVFLPLNDGIQPLLPLSEGDTPVVGGFLTLTYEDDQQEEQTLILLEDFDALTSEYTANILIQLNGLISEMHNLTGTFENTDNNIRYVPGEDEPYTAFNLVLDIGSS